MDLRDIPCCFFKVLHPNYTPSKKEIKKILKQGEGLVKRNWTLSNITNRIVKYDKNHEDTNIYSLFNIISKSKTPPLLKDKNILKDRFYFHHLLQKTSEPTRLKITTDGEVIKKSEPFYLEMKEYFTVKKLTIYFHKKMKLDNKDLARMNYGGFKKMVKSYDLDHILFTIDVARKKLDNQNKEFLTKYIQLYDFLREGRKRYKNAKNSSSKKIVPYYKAYLKRRG